MKKNLLLISLVWFCLASGFAQSMGDVKSPSIKYRRSSIYTLILDDAGLVKADIIKTAFMNAPVPDKYNDHNLSIKSFDPKAYAVSDTSKSKKKKKSSFGKAWVSSATGGLVDTTDITDLPQRIQKFFDDNNIPNGLVAKWFNRDNNGGFNMNLIGERGSWDASEMQANVAKSSARGTAMLADAGEELIGSTFVVVTRLKYIDKKDIAKATKNAMSLIGKFGGAYAARATQLASVAVDAAAKGYVVQSTSYLYKLTWNDSIAAVFYKDYWMNPSEVNLVKKAAFDTTSLFNLELVGTEKAWADVQSSVFSKQPEDTLIKRATVNSVDAVIAKLQKKYDVFKTKTPLYSVNPLSAKIGLKEGLEAGDKFEVLEQVMNENTNKTEYIRRGVIKVEKGKIWDNRYMAAEDHPQDTASTEPPLDKTYFKGSDKYFPGMLIRQIK